LRFIKDDRGEADSKLLAEIGEIKKPIHIQLSYKTFFKLEKFLKENRLDSYSKAIERLVDIGLLLNEHKEEIQNHELLKEFETQYQEGGLVDYFQKLSPSDFKIINSIVKTEDLSRQKTMNSFIEQQQQQQQNKKEGNKRF
jgi:hypothetical protein